MEYILSVFVPLPSDVLKRATAAKAWFGHTWKDIHMISDAHITLQLAKFPKTKHGFDKFIHDLQASHFSALPIILSGVKTKRNKIDNDYFSHLDIEKTKELYKLHKAVLKIVKPYQKGLIRDKDKERLRAGRFSKREIQYLKTYGYARVLQFFHPHITFGEVAHIDAKEQNEILTLLKQKLGKAQRGRFAAAHLIVGLYGYERGKYTNIIRETRVRLVKH